MWMPLRGFLLLAGLLPGAALACPLPGLQQAVAAGSLPAALEALTAIDAAGETCSAAQRAWAGRLVALLHVTQAEAGLRAGRSPAEALAVVDAGLRHGRPWQALALRGDLLQRGQDFAAASLAYQEALNDIAETDPQSNPVPEAEIERLHRLAQQARMLAPDFVPSPPARDGTPGGLARLQVRSLVVTRVAMPIHFEFGTARFTAAGARAADELLRLLDAAGQPPILLVGHTDPVGDDLFNLRLSLRRAEAVRDYLLRRGYGPGRIEVDGRGKREPLRIEERDGYTIEQIHQILRRVELVRR